MVERLITIIIVVWKDNMHTLSTKLLLLLSYQHFAFVPFGSIYPQNVNQHRKKRNSKKLPLDKNNKKTCVKSRWPGWHAQLSALLLPTASIFDSFKCSSGSVFSKFSFFIISIFHVSLFGCFEKNVLSLVGACVVVSVLLLRLFALHRENNESFLAVVAPAALNAELKHSPHGLNAVRERSFF